MVPMKKQNTKHAMLFILFSVVIFFQPQIFNVYADINSDQITPNAIRTPDGGWITPITQTENGTKLNLHYEVGQTVSNGSNIVPIVPLHPPIFITQNTLLPLQQIQSGISLQDVKCNSSLILIVKVEDNSPACVKQSSADVLIARGWGKPLPVNETTGQSSNPIVTLQDNNSVIHLNVGQSFLLKLGETYDWNISIDNQTVISRVMNVMVIRGAQGLYNAHNPGETILMATGDPQCRSTVPACEMPSILFKIDIIIS